MWSTQSAMRGKNGCCVYNIAKKAEHIGLVLSMDTLGDNTDELKAVTGSSDCCLKLWHIGACDVVSEKTYLHAHADAITGLAASPESKFCFVSCSRDKSISHWDYRVPTPVVDFYESDFAYNDIAWSVPNGGHAQIVAGNECGEIHVFDSRNIKSLLKRLQGFSGKPVYRMKFNSNNIERGNKNLVAVLGQSNVVKVFDTGNGYNLIYESNGASDFVRDVHWCHGDANKFYTVGWSEHTAVHEIKSF